MNYRCLLPWFFGCQVDDLTDTFVCALSGGEGCISVRRLKIFGGGGGGGLWGFEMLGCHSSWVSFAAAAEGQGSV